MPPSLLAVALCAVSAAAFSSGPLRGQQRSVNTALLDTDHDGLSDESEAALLARFSPAFFVAQQDCSVLPAQFLPEQRRPTVLADDGTVYAQATPRRGHADEVELHYYHLWRRDCGELGHALDTEHVSALVRMSNNEPTSATALLWYAAAHENTVCDASHLVRADAIHAGDRGAAVWISPGKHASFLSEVLCTHGCGSDRCNAMLPMKTRAIVNLGEAGAPMNGIAWLLSADWPLQQKMLRSDFTDSRVARIERGAQSDVVWATPSKRPAQAAILAMNAGIGGGATGARATDTALALTGGATGDALSTSAHHTGNALDQSTRAVWHALQKSARKTGRLLQPKDTPTIESTPPQR